MRCLGCDKVIKSRSRRAASWDLFQLCPICFDQLVPEYYSLRVKRMLVKA